MQDGVLDLYDTFAKQPEGFGGFGRTLPGLLFPNVSRWEHLFDVWTTEKTLAPEPYIIMGVPADHYYSRERRDPQIGPFMTLDTARCGGQRYGSAWVRAKMEVNHGLVQSMAGIWSRGETISFNIIAWNEQQAIVTAHYSLILGDIWIAIIEPQSIPEELRHATVPQSQPARAAVPPQAG